MRRASIALVALTLASPSVLGADVQALKAPWQWTDAERIASRSSSIDAQARVREAQRRASAAAVAAHEQSAKGGSSTNDAVDIVLGSEHPELLLPTELFDRMITMAYSDDDDVRAIFRDSKALKLRQLGLPNDFWSKFAPAAYEIVNIDREARNEHEKLAGNLSRSEAAQHEMRMRALPTMRCQARAAALAWARQTFGEPFDRFLYEAIAPDVFVISRVVPTAEALERVIGGCR